MRKKPKILVVGSFVMDMIVSTERFSNEGETVLGKSFQTASGGKGANQAVQAARLGADVTIVGKVGTDDFGKRLIQSCAEAGIHTEHIIEDPRNSSAVGNVQLEIKDGRAANRIIVVPGANMAIQKDDVVFLKDTIEQYDIVILQMEIPMEINELVAEYAFSKGVPVMLNPAPSAPIPSEMLSRLDYLAPNEHEAADLTGTVIRKSGASVNKENVNAAVSSFLEKGIKNVVITLGNAGAVLANREEFLYQPCVGAAEAKDPTAAGDSFVGAFAVGVSSGLTHAEALRFASYAAALTVSAMGAQPSLPNLDKVLNLMKKEKEQDFTYSLLDALRPCL